MEVLILIYHFCPHPFASLSYFFFFYDFLFIYWLLIMLFSQWFRCWRKWNNHRLLLWWYKDETTFDLHSFFFFLAYLTDIHFWFSMWRETLKRQRFGRPIEIFVCPMPPPMQAILFIVLHFYSYILTFSFIIQTNFNSQGNAWNHYYPFCFLGCWITLSLFCFCFCFLFFFFQKSWNWYLLCYQFVNVAAKNLT